MEEPTLLANLALAVGVAFLGGILASRLGQSPMLGFILGGIFIGPYSPGLVLDVDAVNALADIGIILLLFTVGVQLSLKDLLAAGRTALIGGSLQVLAIIGIGYVVGQALGWGTVESLFFGSVISNSSSTVLSKVLGERGQEGSIHGQVSLAWSTVQDLSTIFLVIVLSQLAVGGDGNIFVELVQAGLMAALFLVLLFTIGSRVLPWFFEHVATPENRELFIIAVGAFALGTAYLSTFFGLSLALGAFVAGVVVSESDLWHQILGVIVPLRDVFAALFFVSVGMFVDPGFVVMNLPLVLLAAALIVIVKGILVTGISLIFQYPVRVSILIGITLAQSAEFSFLLARLGADSNAISSEMFSLMLAGAVLSIVVAPILHSVGNPLAERASRLFPESDLSHMPTMSDVTPQFRSHAIICGYGRVGRVVGQALRRRGLPFIVIEQDRTIVQQLRADGIVALYGTADNPIILERAQIDRARLLLIALDDALASRQVVGHARRRNERIDIIARAHSTAEREYLRRQGVEEAIFGELELALELTRFALNRFGVGSLEIQALLQRVRLGDEKEPFRE